MKLEVKNLHKSFGETEVLHGISFSVESGRALGLLGRNGAGKTTTIRILMQVFGANEGTVLLDGVPFSPKKIGIGYLPEERGLYPKKTVTEQLMYLAALRGMKRTEAAKAVKHWLLSWPKEMKRWLLLSVPMRCMEVPASILDAFLQKHWFIRQSWLR